MYVVTFYSFKGGVGRSLALANVGAQLALTGRRVLLVDLDLEAPGLDTFEQLRSKSSTKGITDFVCDFVQTKQAPEAIQYMYECPAFNSDGGALWLMPAGSSTRACYSTRLASIDWQKLYSELDGYLLFEDLKAQWEKQLNPDYVLIDSRTGYTDVAGICTRQLPDAVVLLFFPNEQNLQGLKEIVAAIRDEENGPRQKKIQIHFVTSNVPDLDDEDQILSRTIRKFRIQLGYDQLAATIHHYPSLALLNQVIFTKERPRSRLAKEYRGLCMQIVRENLRDREGALIYLRIPDEIPFRGRPRDIEQDLEEIRDNHSSDGEVLAGLGRTYAKMGNSEKALSLYDQAMSLGFEDSALLMDYARLSLENGNSDSAVKSAWRILKLQTAGYFEVSSAVKILAKHNPVILEKLPDSPAFKSLERFEQSNVAQEMLVKRDLLPIAESVMRSVGWDSEDARNEENEDDKVPLVICLIGQGKYQQAMATISRAEPTPTSLGVADAFNYAMAKWGHTGDIPMEFFARVVECDMKSRLEGTRNRIQCAALAYWAIGNIEEARLRILQARNLMSSRPQTDFSCWRYLIVTATDFLADLDAMEHMINGEPLIPEAVRIGNRVH